MKRGITVSVAAAIMCVLTDLAPGSQRLLGTSHVQDINEDGIADLLVTWTDQRGRGESCVVSGADGSVLCSRTVPYVAWVGTSSSSSALDNPIAVARRFVVERDNIDGATDMVGAFALDLSDSGAWGAPGTVVTSSVDGTLHSYRVRAYGQASGGDPTFQQWTAYTGWKVDYWPTVADFLLNPQQGTVELAFEEPSNLDAFLSPKGNYNGLTQYDLEFDLRSAGIQVAQGQQYVLAVTSVLTPLGVTLYHSFSTVYPEELSVRVRRFHAACAGR